MTLRTATAMIAALVTPCVSHAEPEKVIMDYPQPGASWFELRRMNIMNEAGDLAESRDTVFLCLPVIWRDGAWVTCIQKKEQGYRILLRLYMLRKNGYEVDEEIQAPMEDEIARSVRDLWSRWLGQGRYTTKRDGSSAEFVWIL